MAQQHQGWITLDSIIYDYISEAELSQNKYFKLFHLSYRCMESLGLDFFYQVKSVKLPINANKTVTLPADFINYNKLGVLNGNGELVPLRYNENLTTLNDLRSTRVADVSATNFLNFYSYSSPVFFNFWNGDSYGNLYGIAGGYNYGGGFKVDAQNGVILLDVNYLWDNIVLEYTASPTEGQDYHVPLAFRETIIAWLAWKDIANLKANSHYGLGQTRDRRHEYFEARRKGISQYRPFYLDQAYIESLGNSRLTVKS